MYSEEYYAERKKELEADFNKKVSTSLQKFFALTGEVQQELQDIQRKFQDLETKERAGKEAKAKENETAAKAEEILKDADKNKKNPK